MTQARVGLAQASSGQLPAVCICCGRPATRLVYHKFYYRPTWLVIARCFLGYLISLAVGAYRKVCLNVPVCEQHSWRLKLPTYATFTVLGWLLLGIVASIAGTAIGAGMDGTPVGGYVALVFFLPLIPMLIGLMVLQILTPRTEFFDHQTVGFTAVAPQFAHALGQGQQFGSPGMPYGAPQQPQYGASTQFKPYAGVAGPTAPARRQGGMSTVAIVLVVAGIVVVGFVLVAGVGLVGLAMLLQPRARPMASAPVSPDIPTAAPDFGPPPSSPRSGAGSVGPSSSTSGGAPGQFERPFPSGGPPGAPFGPGTFSSSPSTPGASSPGTSTPGASPSTSERGPSDPFSGSGRTPFGPGFGPGVGPRRPPSAGGFGESFSGAPEASGRATKFPEKSTPVMGSTKLKRGDKLWGLDLGTWRMVEVLEPGTGNGVKIHWIGWSDSWDQVLTFDKLRIPEGAAVAAKTPDAAAPSKDPVTPSEPTTPGKTEKPAGVEVRTWSDFTGKFKIEAEFVSFDKGMVVLKKADGTTTTISIARLSPADQQYVFERMTSKP